MGFRRRCYVESKVFELDVEGGSPGLRLCKISRVFTQTIFLGKKDAYWLLETVEELLSVKDSSMFWKRSRVGVAGFVAQHCANKHGRFLVVEDFGSGRKRGSIYVPEGKKGEGWESFRSELHSVVHHMKAYNGGVRYQSKEHFDSLAFKSSPTVEIPVPHPRRSFAEVLRSSKVPEPLLSTKSFRKLLKRAEMEEVQNSMKPMKLDVRQTVAPKAETINHEKVMGHADFASVGEKELRDTLEGIKGDVEKCLVWMDSGLLKYQNGLMGSAPKTYAVVHGKGQTKRKTKVGILGSQPKVI